MTANTNPWPFFVMFMALLVCIMIAWALRRRNVTIMPESALFIAVGVVIGAINYGIHPGVPLTLFDSNLFLYGFLPIIIFEAGFSMNKREFFNNIGVINMLAIVGTVISTLVVGYGLWWFETLGFYALDNNPLVPLLFGTLISAVDPVATLVVFSSLNVDRMLYSIVFGESVMNDAVAVALYQTFALFLGLESFGAKELFEALGLFIAKFVGSFFVAMIVAMLLAYILKHNRVEINYMVFAIFGTTGYIVYNLCEGIKLSGILGVFFYGMALKHYAFYNVSRSAQHGSEDFLKTLAALAESVIYIYLGMSFFDVTVKWNAIFIAWSCALCLVGRALNVFPLVNFTNLFRVRKVSFRFQLLIWHSGLRGAIAFALSLLIPIGEGGVSQQAQEMIVAATLFIVVATTVLVGGSTPLALRALNIKMNDIVTEEEIVSFAEHERALAMHRTIHDRWHHFDRSYLIPLLSNRDVSGMHKSGLIHVPANSSMDREAKATDPLLSSTSPNVYGSNSAEASIETKGTAAI